MARKSTSAGSPRSSSSRRRPVTIDLEAKSADKTADTAEAKLKPAASDKPDSAAGGPVKTSDTKPKPDNAAATPSSATAKQTPSANVAKPVEKPAEKPVAALPVEPKTARGSGSLVVAGLIGGAVSIAGIIGLHRLDVVDIFSSSQSVSSDDVTALKQQLAETRAQADALGAELNAKITALSQSPAASDASLGGAVDEIRAEIENLRGEIGKAAAAATGTADLAPLDERLIALEKLIGSGGSGREVALEALENRLATSDDAIKDLQGAVGDGSQWTKAIEALKSELTHVSEQANMAEAGQVESISNLQSEFSALQRAVDEVKARTDKVASSDAVQNAVDTAEAAARKADQAVAIAPVLAAESLQRAIEAGQPFDTALSAFESLGIEDPALTALQPYAADGLPTLAALTAEFAGISEALRNSDKAAADEDAGAVDRLLKGAFSIVEVRPAEPLKGTDPLAIRSRIEAAIKSNDFDNAMTEWETLPDDDKAASQVWADKVRAIALSRSFAGTVRAEALARLNTTQ